MIWGLILLRQRLGGESGGRAQDLRRTARGMLTSQNTMCTQPGIPEVSVQPHREQDEVRERWGGEETGQQGLQGEGTEGRTMNSVM